MIVKNSNPPPLFFFFLNSVCYATPPNINLTACVTIKVWFVMRWVSQGAGRVEGGGASCRGAGPVEGGRGLWACLCWMKADGWGKRCFFLFVLFETWIFTIKEDIGRPPLVFVLKRHNPYRLSLQRSRRSFGGSADSWRQRGFKAVCRLASPRAFSDPSALITFQDRQATVGYQSTFFVVNYFNVLEACWFQPGICIVDAKTPPKIWFYRSTEMYY